MVSRLELVAELDALGFTRKNALPLAWEDYLRRRLSPLRRSLRITREEEGDEDEPAYEGRVKFMENLIADIVESKLEKAKFEIIEAIQQANAAQENAAAQEKNSSLSNSAFHL